jgi:XapX domain-containing protein
MKAPLISFVTGLPVGVVYGVVRVKSPAPPIAANDCITVSAP